MNSSAGTGAAIPIGAAVKSLQNGRNQSNVSNCLQLHKPLQCNIRLLFMAENQVSEISSLIMFQIHKDNRKSCRKP